MPRAILDFNSNLFYSYRTEVYRDEAVRGCFNILGYETEDKNHRTVVIRDLFHIYIISAKTSVFKLKNLANCICTCFRLFALK